MNRPDYVKCIRSPFEQQKHTVCGRLIGAGEFVLMDIGHAYMLGDQASLQACPGCVDEAVRGLLSSRYDSNG